MFDELPTNGGSAILPTDQSRVSMNRMTVLLTGGAGFIGSCLARRLLAEGHTVVVVDNVFTGKLSNVPEGALFVQGDVGRPETYSSLPDLHYDTVCHLAAQSSGAVSMEQPLYDMQTNAVSTVLLARWSQQRLIKRFVYASSMSVYGASRSPVAEDALSAPLSYYGISKLASEHVLRLISASGIMTTTFRMFNVYGPGQNLENLRQGMASIYLAYLLKGESVPVTGALGRYRDFVYIDDVVNAWMVALAKPIAARSSVYNLGSGVPTTVRSLLDLLIAACGLPADHPVSELPAQAGDQFGLFADVRRADIELGWRSRMPLEEGIRRMVDWARTQRER